MKAVGVIPARYGSTRFPGKVLVPIFGKPMIQHVWQRTKLCRELHEVIIACDDDRVLKTAKDFGAKVVMTSAHHPSGSDRIAEVVAKLDVDVVVNIQGDEPFIDSLVIDRLVLALKNNSKISVGTVVKRITSEEELNNPNVVKVVLDANQCALYFSRAGIPYNRNQIQPSNLKYFKHIGLYAYRRDFLLKFKDWPKSMLESTEQLEQLRILEAGYKIQTLETETDSVAVDTPEDLKKIEQR